MTRPLCNQHLWVFPLFAGWMIATACGPAITPPPTPPPATWDGPARPYYFPRSHFDTALQNATTDAERYAIYHERWADVKLIVGHAHVATDHGFWRSVSMWTSMGSSFPIASGPRHQGDLTSHMLSNRDSGIVIEGDVLAPLNASAGGAVHILGDVDEVLDVYDHSSVVIGGMITPNGKLILRGIGAIFVAGDVLGEIECHSMSLVWIGGDLVGKLSTGDPSTHISIFGNLDGIVQPTQSASLVNLTVGGYVQDAQLKAIEAFNYTTLVISVGASDLPRGLHSRGKFRGELWTVHRGPLTRAKFDAGDFGDGLPSDASGD